MYWLLNFVQLPICVFFNEVNWISLKGLFWILGQSVHRPLLSLVTEVFINLLISLVMVVVSCFPYSSLCLHVDVGVGVCAFEEVVTSSNLHVCYASGRLSLVRLVWGKSRLVEFIREQQGLWAAWSGETASLVTWTGMTHDCARTVRQAGWALRLGRAASGFSGQAGTKCTPWLFGAFAGFRVQVQAETVLHSWVGPKDELCIHAGFQAIFQSQAPWSGKAAGKLCSWQGCWLGSLSFFFN